MKTQKERVGTRAKIRAMKERERKMALAAMLLILVASVSGFIIFSLYSSSEGGRLPEPTFQFKPEYPNPELRAALVDHLSLTAPNGTFVQASISTLTKANYTVDYYRGEQVTVDFYRNLPTGGYRLVVLRVHSALLRGEGPEKDIVNLFTSEPYSRSSHVSEQLNNELVLAKFDETSTAYFGITPSFIRNCMKGTFDKATIIMMGCNGLMYMKTAEAFIGRGARVYISWNGKVSTSHTDEATTCLIQHVVIAKETIGQGVEETMKEVGQDPDYGSLLGYYPLEIGNQTVD